MKFSENNNSSIIDEIYKSKFFDYEEYVAHADEEKRDYAKIDELLEDINDFCKSGVPANVKKAIKEKCDELDRVVSKEIDFWERKFYKLGFIDGMRMAEDLKTETKINEEDEE